jgi:hypothetical protein
MSKKRLSPEAAALTALLVGGLFCYLALGAWRLALKRPGILKPPLDRREFVKLARSCKSRTELGLKLGRPYSTKPVVARGGISVPERGIFARPKPPGSGDRWVYRWASRNPESGQVDFQAVVMFDQHRPEVVDGVHFTPCPP